MRAVQGIVSAEGFVLHKDKTRVLRKSVRQTVTGLVVNESAGAAARPNRTYVRNLRAAIHKRENGQPGKGESLEQLRGMAAFVFMSDPGRGKPLLDRIDALQAKESEE